MAVRVIGEDAGRDFGGDEGRDLVCEVGRDPWYLAAPKL
jgi:hypothetical protein